MLVDPINAVGWLGEPRTRTGVADYTYKREITHTGDLIDAPTGDRIGKIHDVTPHRADPQTAFGSPGPTCLASTKRGRVTLGSFELDARKLTVSGTAASVAVGPCTPARAYTTRTSHGQRVGGSLHHRAPRRLFKVFAIAKQRRGRGEPRRVLSGIRDKDFEPGKMYTIVAVCTEEGRMRLCDGGVARRGRRQRAARFETSRTRKRRGAEGSWAGHVVPVRAGILSVERSTAWTTRGQGGVLRARGVRQRRMKRQGRTFRVLINVRRCFRFKNVKPKGGLAYSSSAPSAVGLAVLCVTVRILVQSLLDIGLPRNPVVCASCGARRRPPRLASSRFLLGVAPEEYPLVRDELVDAPQSASFRCIDATCRSSRARRRPWV